MSKMVYVLSRLRYESYLGDYTGRMIGAASMDAKVTWRGRMNFSGTADTGYILPLDTDPDVGGGNEGFKPMELLLIGLVGCTGMDVISILLKKRQQVTAFQVTAHAERAKEHPKVFTKVLLEYQVTGVDIDARAVERAIELSETKYCPAQAMLMHSVTINHTYDILEAPQ
jgi:putative redox protein